MDIQAVLFDIDGTLVDSNERHVDAWAFAFRDEGLPQELDDIRTQIGKGGDLLVPALLPDVGKDVHARISNRHGELFKDMYLDHVRPFDCASAIIERVHQTGRKVVLASSAKAEELDHYVGLLDVEAMLAATTSIDDVDASKPEPDIFSVALGKVGIDASHAIVVGDTPYDVEAARRAGVAAIGLTSGPFDEKALKEAGAIAVFADVAALLQGFDRSPLAK
jgi:phosphoglycolate phosphatase-like HAD superfamily hydrolase